MGFVVGNQAKGSSEGAAVGDLVGTSVGALVGFDEGEGGPLKTLSEVGA